MNLTEETPVDEVHFAFDNDTEENKTGNLPLIGTQETPVCNFEENLRNWYSLKSHHDRESDDINAKIMALKAFLMDEKYTLRQDLSSIQEKLHQTIKFNENNNICPKEIMQLMDLKLNYSYWRKRTYH